MEPRRVRLSGGEEVLLRTCTREDAPGLLAHRLHMAVTSPHNVVSPDEVEDDLEKQVQWIEDRVSRAHELNIIATSDSAPGLIVGSLHFQSFDKRILAHHGSFGISVDAAWRGKGVGSALIAALLDWARAHPTIEKVCLGVYEDNHSARRLYERLGFKEEGRREKFFKTADRGYVDDIQMCLWIKPPSP
jgi:RimJ/RimL family protein N-acetyltransferase